MSLLNEKEIPCTFCKFPNSVDVWSVVNVKEDPELKDLLLGGELNMGECSSCKKIFYAESFLLYHDPDSELLAFVYPFEDRNDRATFEQKTRTDFETLKSGSADPTVFSYDPETFFGLDELVRLLEEEEEQAIQSDIVAAMAPALNLPIVTVAPWIARKFKIPRVVPGIQSLQSYRRDLLLSGLKSIESANPRLSVYVEWGKRVAENSSYELSLA